VRTCWPCASGRTLDCSLPELNIVGCVGGCLLIGDRLSSVNSISRPRLLAEARALACSLSTPINSPVYSHSNPKAWAILQRICCVLDVGIANWSAGQ
jgi:hypothetical protein